MAVQIGTIPCAGRPLASGPEALRIAQVRRIGRTSISRPFLAGRKVSGGSTISARPIFSSISDTWSRRSGVTRRSPRHLASFSSPFELEKECAIWRMRTPSWVPYSVAQETGYRVPPPEESRARPDRYRTGPSAILPPSSQPGPSLSYTGLYLRRSGPLTLAGRPSRLNKILSLEPPTTRGAELHPLGVGLASFEVIEEDPSVLA